MPPPRPRGIGCSTGIATARPNPNTPMSERQQMALLIQMTASSGMFFNKPKEYISTIKLLYLYLKVICE